MRRNYVNDWEDQGTFKIFGGESMILSQKPDVQKLIEERVTS